MPCQPVNALHSIRNLRDHRHIPRQPETGSILISLLCASNGSSVCDWRRPKILALNRKSNNATISLERAEPRHDRLHQARPFIRHALSRTQSARLSPPVLRTFIQTHFHLTFSPFHAPASYSWLRGWNGWAVSDIWLARLWVICCHSYHARSSRALFTCCSCWKTDTYTFHDWGFTDLSDHLFSFSQVDCWFDLIFLKPNWQPWMFCQHWHGVCDGFNFHVIHDWTGCCWCLLWASFRSYTPPKIFLSDFFIPFLLSLIRQSISGSLLSYQSSHPRFWSFSFPFFHVHGFNIHASCWYLLAHIISICLYKVRLICFGVYVIPFNDLVMTWTNNVILFLFFLWWIFPLLVSCSGSSVLNSNYSYIECLSGREANRTEMEYLSWYWIFA